MPEKENEIGDFLLFELREGQERAFDFIFRKYYKALCALAITYVKDLDKAQSLVQDCFIKLWINRKELNQIQSLSSYLSYMVRNKCIDELRGQKKQKRLAEKSTTEEKTHSTEELILNNEFEEKLVIALSTLPERSRLAFEYSRFDNLTYKEISEKMGISVKAVEALVSRALKILRIELKDYLPILIILNFL